MYIIYTYLYTYCIYFERKCLTVSTATQSMTNFLPANKQIVAKTLLKTARHKTSLLSSLLSSLV